MPVFGFECRRKSVVNGPWQPLPDHQIVGTWADADYWCDAAELFGRDLYDFRWVLEVFDMRRAYHGG